MPIREYTCEDHGTFEIFDKTFDPKDHYPCTTEDCDRYGLLQISLTSMQPDKYWNGVSVLGTVVHSRKEYLAKMKNLTPYDENAKVQVAKNRERRIKEKADKAEAKLNDFVQRTVQDYDEKPDSSFTNKQLRKMKQVVD